MGKRVKSTSGRNPTRYIQNEMSEYRMTCTIKSSWTILEQGYNTVFPRSLKLRSFRKESRYPRHK